MSLSSIFLSIQLLFLPLFQAQDVFDYDQNGLITYSSVVEQKGVTKEILMQNAKEFFESSDKKTKRKRKFLKLNVQDSLLEYSRSSILYAKSLGKYPEGKLSYTIKLELREERYRYVIQNFIFTPYEKNRYAKYEAVRGKFETLESMMAKSVGNKKDDARYASIDNKINALINTMNLAMATALNESNKNIVEINNDW